MHCALCGVYWNQGAAIGWKGWMVAADKGNILIANKEFTLTHQTNDREFGHKYKWKYKYKYMWPDKINILIAKKLLTLTQSLRIRHKYSNAIKSFDSDLGFLISKEWSIACREKILVTFQPIAFSAK